MPGGVCAVLDYDVDTMSEYVAEMATRIVMPQSPVNPAFRKFVSQILTSTRLPSTTILLGMNYLAKRINILKASGSSESAYEGQIWRMLTVALLLGSKFLDDNTFQNRSWSEVSGLSVSELNTMEYQWLASINWSLYVNLDRSKDYNAWLKNWKEWLDIKTRQQAQAHRERLASLVTPIETDVARPRNPQTFGWAKPTTEYDRVPSVKRPDHAHQHQHHQQQQQQQQQPSYRVRDQAWQPQQYQSAWHHQPLTPPDSAFGTPEYINSATSSATSRYNDWFAQAAANSSFPRAYPSAAQASHAAYPSARANSNYHHNYYNSGHYAHGIWESGVMECNCGTCVGPVQSKQQPYFATHGYGQPVMG